MAVYLKPGIMDIIFIKDFRIALVIGVYEWERQAAQEIRLDLEIAIAESSIPHSDDVKDTIDYAKVVASLQQELPRQSFYLVEKLAEFVAEFLLNEFKTPWVRIRVTKQNILPYVAEVGVMIERRHCS